MAVRLGRPRWLLYWEPMSRHGRRTKVVSSPGQETRCTRHSIWGWRVRPLDALLCHTPIQIKNGRGKQGA